MIIETELSPSERIVEARASWRRWSAIWLALGVLLRVLVCVFPRQPDDDSDVYLELGHNLFHHFVYGFSNDDGSISPALFRLPGYPIFLELLGEQKWLVSLAQCGLDLAGCWLLALAVRRACGQRAGLATLALSTSCFFTAAYASCELTESLSIFAVAAAIYCLGEVLAGDGAFTFANWWRRLLPLAGTAMLAMMVRPDGTLLTISTAVALVVYGVRRAGWVAAVRTAALFGCLAAMPLIPWAIRNAVTYHVFQPLAPRHVNDPGERVNSGFYDWLRTWSVDFETTGLVFWKVGTDKIYMRDLPARACDSPEQCARTSALIAEYNQGKDLSQSLDDRFGALARERVRTHPVRSFVGVPALRVADMWLRPRTEGMSLDVSWWRWREHRWQSAAAAALGLLNLGYVLLAVWGAFRRPPLAVFLLTYLGLRCLLLSTLENPEPRYTLEAFPILFVLGAMCFRARRNGEKAD